MGVEFDWLDQNSHISFPLAPPQPEFIRQVFVDACVVDGSDNAEALVLESLEVYEDHAAISLVYSSSLLPFFDGEPESRVIPFGQWLVVAFDDYANNKHVAFTLDRRYFSLPLVSYPISATIQPHCVDRSPRMVNRIFVEDEYGATFAFQGNVDFVAGYNMNIDVQEPAEMFDVGSRQATGLVFNCIPGVGEGLQPNDCSGDGYLRSINGIGPDKHGNFDLSGNGCYRVWRPVQSYTLTVVILESNTLQMANSCEACCECQDYANVYSAMQRLYNKGTDVGDALKSIGSKANRLNEDLATEKIDRAQRRMKLSLKRAQGYVVGVLITFQNNTPGSSVSLWSDHTTIRISGDPDCTFPNCKVNYDQCWVYNEYYQDWALLDVAEMFTSWIPDVLDLSPSTSPGDQYGLIRGTQYATVYFELYFNEAADEDEVTVRVENSTFGTAQEKTVELIRGTV